jgi:hypothetical protein
MRILKVLFFLAALPIMAAAQSAQGQAQRRDPCTLPEGGVRRGAPADAKARAQSSGLGQKSGLNQDRSVNCTPTPPPGDELPPPTSETAEIQGTAFGDLDMSFTRDPGEPGLPGRTITLSGPVSASTLTDADGNYSFVGLPVGTYVVCQSPEISSWQSVPMVGADCGASGQVGYTLVVVSPILPGTRFLGNDFGNVLIP